MPTELLYTFNVHNSDAVSIALGLTQPASLVNDITKEKGTSKYTIRYDEALEHVIEGVLKALQYIQVISNVMGPFPAYPRVCVTVQEPLYMDALKPAVQTLKSRENRAALEEGLGDICSDLIAVLPYHNGITWEMRALFDYGQEGDRTGKTAHIWKINDMKYELEWV